MFYFGGVGVEVSFDFDRRPGAGVNNWISIFGGGKSPAQRNKSCAGPRIAKACPNKELGNIRKAADLISQFQLSKARRFLESNGLGDHNDHRIVQQLSNKHPAQKEEMTPRTPRLMRSVRV